MKTDHLRIIVLPPRSALIKRRIFRYVESVVRDNIRNFKPISNNLQIHHLYTSKSGEIVVSDLAQTMSRFVLT
jgi:hypothetical protein